MKPTTKFDATMLENEHKFNDRFFKQFDLRPMKEPLRLSDDVTKNYMFPTFYSDVTCAMAIFLCDYKKAKTLMPHPKVKPVKMTMGRSLVAFSCYEYKNVLNIPPYNEIAMTIPVMVDPKVNVPVLPMVTEFFKEFGYYVFSMPVTSLENRIRGNNIWGLPKVVREIDIREEGGVCATEAFEEDGSPYLRVNVPMDGKPEKFDVSSYLYTRLGDKFLRSKTCFRATFNVTKNMDLLFKAEKKPDREYLWLGDGPSAEAARSLNIEETPFQLRFAKHMNACFDLPEEGYRAPIKY